MRRPSRSFDLLGTFSRRDLPRHYLQFPRNKIEQNVKSTFNMRNRAMGAAKSWVCAIGTLSLSILVAACGSSDRPAETNPLIFIGIDGATWDVIDDMIAAGDLPTFKDLKTRGAYGELISIGPMVSPVIWTTHATGRFARDHGILDFTYPYKPGPAKPVQSTHRQVPAIWNIASDAGKSVAAVGYFASFPADTINGVFVSERSRQGLDGAITPPNALEEISQQLDELNRLNKRKALWSRFFPWDYEPPRRRSDDEPPAQQEASRLVTGRVDNRIITDEFYRRAGQYLLESRDWDLFINYLRIIDYAQHSLWYYFEDDDWDQKPNEGTRALLGDIIPESYRYTDEMLADVLKSAPDNANIVLVSDHGMGSATGRYSVAEERAKDLTGNHRRNGLFLAVGPDINPGRVVGMTTLEVMPLLTTLLGLPLSDELPGQVPYDALSDRLADAGQPATVPSYGSYSFAGTVEISEEDQRREMDESLKGLGYIGEFEVADADDGGYDFWASSDAIISNQLVGEIMYYLIQGDQEAADAVLRDGKQFKARMGRAIPAGVESALKSLRDVLPPDDYNEAAFEQFLARHSRTD